MTRTYFILLIGVLFFSFIWSSVPIVQEEASPASKSVVLSENSDLSETETTKTMPTSPAEKKVYMTAREHNGLLCIFESDDSENPSISLDVRVDSLPKADRDMFKKGVPLYSQAELSSLIEDYTS